MHRSILAGLALLLFCCLPASAQTTVSLELAGGGDLGPWSGVGGAEVTVEPWSGRTAPYLGVGVVSMGNDCQESLPPSCRYPETPLMTVRGGVRWIPAPDDLPFYLGAGVGAAVWNGIDPSAHLEAGVRVPIRDGLEIEFGTMVDRIWPSSPRDDGTRVSSSQYNLFLASLGMRFQLGSPSRMPS